MASIRKHYGKWQVHIRKKFAKPIVKSFISKEDADKYARELAPDNFWDALTDGDNSHFTAGLVGSCWLQKLRYVTVELGFFRGG